MSRNILADASTMSFVVSTKPDEAKKYYGEVLGLTLLSEDEYGLVFSAGRDSLLRIQRAKEHKPLQGTVFGWNVGNIDKAVEELSGRGVSFENYGFPTQDSRGVCTFQNGDQVAWFKDQDGNTLSISQLKES